MNVTFLGTGTSHGVPSLDCMMDGFTHCPKGVCKESFVDPRHNRTRCSILVRHDGGTLLVDVSADFRQQSMRERITRIDAVLITHKHADHIMGLPDIRSYCRKPESPLPVYASYETTQHIRSTFAYIFDPNTCVGGGIPHLTLHDVATTFMVAGVEITPLPVEHGSLTGCFGFRIGPLAYIPDMKRMPDSTCDLIVGCELLVLNCLRDTRPHPTHSILPESLAIARKVGVKRCFFTHFSHDIHYKEDANLIDANCRFAYDGLTVEL